MSLWMAQLLYLGSCAGASWAKQFGACPTPLPLAASTTAAPSQQCTPLCTMMASLWPTRMQLLGFAFTASRLSYNAPLLPLPCPHAEYIPRLRRFLVECWGDEYAAHLRAGGIKL